jgi:hypothetical protein
MGIPLCRVLPDPESSVESDFGDLLDSFAPAPSDLVLLIKAYFDESYDQNLLCVAGYLFTSPLARALDAEWKSMLFKYRLPYFRMSACNANRPPFDHLTGDECVEVATHAIRLIHKYAILGFAITVDQAAFHRVITPKGFVSTPYELATWHGLIPVRLWTDEHARASKTAYLFESGFQHDGIANVLMNRIFAIPRLRAEYRYKSHGFVDKADCRPLQAADVLAWQWYKDSTRKAKGLMKPRGDLSFLLNGTAHWALHVDESSMRETLDIAQRVRSGEIDGREIARLENMRLPGIFPKLPGDDWDQGTLNVVRQRAVNKILGK